MEIEANVEDESRPSFASSNWENRSPVEIPAALTGVLLLQCHCDQHRALLERKTLETGGLRLTVAPLVVLF